MAGQDAEERRADHSVGGAEIMKISRQEAIKEIIKDQQIETRVIWQRR